MGILALLGFILIVLAILKLVGVLAIGAAWVTLLIVGIVLLFVSAWVWDIGPGPRRGRWVR